MTNIDGPNAQKAQNTTNSKGEASNSSQKQKKNADQEDDGNHHNKKSVLAKVKEKAKRLRISLSGRKRRDENDLRGPTTAPSSGVSLEPKDEDAKHHSAPNTSKQSTQDHPQKAPIPAPEKHAAEQIKDEPASSSNTTTEPLSEKEPPSVDSTQTNDPKTHAPQPESTDSKLSSLTISTSEKKGDEPIEGSENMKGESQTWDKGVSVKEYLMHKFEPGEDERALSQVITQTISPRRDKMRDAMTSFLKNDESSNSTGANSSIPPTNLNPNLKSKSVPASAGLNTDMASKSAAMNPSYSLGSNDANASSNLNETFKSTIASYQNQNLGSSPNQNPGSNPSATSSSPDTNLESNQSSTLPLSPTKTSLPPLADDSTANLTHSPDSSPNQTHGPDSSPNQTQAPSPTDSTANQVSVPGHTDTNTTQSPDSTVKQTTDTSAAGSPGSTANQTEAPDHTNANPTGVSHKVVEDENRGTILEAK